ncbi:hypothetical protein K7X08_033152 [Anisodus acutangulus]|uniref:Uncharacterized protein n=1 Tax=Anisodus acutangulus TaxID=402998 RepID=A0A9Q1M253_9SOLA|nr:hypothetical protein K7X08_033152 [Anisodus acutangulus]
MEETGGLEDLMLGQEMLLCEYHPAVYIEYTAGIPEVQLWDLKGCDAPGLAALGSNTIGLCMQIYRNCSVVCSYTLDILLIYRCIHASNVLRMDLSSALHGLSILQCSGA